jgi:hypothetical protein
VWIFDGVPQSEFDAGHLLRTLFPQCYAAAPSYRSRGVAMGSYGSLFLAGSSHLQSRYADVADGRGRTGSRVVGQLVDLEPSGRGEAGDSGISSSIFSSKQP